jgi:subtilase family serine protease
MHMRLGRVRLVASAAVITTAAGVTAAVAIPAADAAAAGPRVALTSSAATPAPAGSARLGQLAAATPLTVDVTLKLGNEAGLDALLAGQADPASPYFGQYVGKDEFGPEFGLPLSAVTQVESALRAEGLSVGELDPDRLYIPVSGTAASVGRAFGVTLNRYRLPTGRVAFQNSAAPKIPESVAPYVQGVLGLDNVYQPASASQHSAAGTAAPAATSTGTTSTGTTSTGTTSTGATSPAGPTVPAAKGAQACASASSAAAAYHGYTPGHLASQYGISALYKLGDLGQGTRVALAELEPNRASDIAGYKKCYGLGTKVYDIVVDKGVGSGAGQGEAALDIEDVASLAPATTIDVYQDGSTTRNPLYDIAAKVAAKDQDQALSISWGLCEVESGSAALSAYSAVFKVLAAKGITTVAASGDSGSTGCYQSGGKKSTALSPWAPASTPYVVSAGGTAVTASGAELTWNGSTTKYGGASGGGVSSMLCMPSYQGKAKIAGLVAKYSVKAKSCKSANDPGGYRREVPDLSADGASSSPYVIYYLGKWYSFWGTSAATATLAAEAALIDSSPFCSARGWGSGKHVGLLPQAVYKIMTVYGGFFYAHSPGYAIRDVTKGTNDDTASGYKGGKYPATRGYDLATGLGTPRLTSKTSLPLYNPGMASEMCRVFAAKSMSKLGTSKVSPASVKAGHAVTVTLKGAGYLEIPGTDRVRILQNKPRKDLGNVAMTCSSHGACTVKIPALKAGTYRLQALVAGFASKSSAVFTVKK